MKTHEKMAWFQKRDKLGHWESAETGRTKMTRFCRQKVAGWLWWSKGAGSPVFTGREKVMASAL